LNETRLKRVTTYFRCALCPTETDDGYELPDGRKVCMECYKKYQKQKEKKSEK